MKFLEPTYGTKCIEQRCGRQCERTFTGHAAPGNCIGSSDSRMYTRSKGCEARLYSFKTDRMARGGGGDANELGVVVGERDFMVWV